MANWMDPDLRNHVDDDSGLRVDNFQEAFAFVENLSNTNYYPYKKKDMYATKSVIYKAMDNEKFAKYNDRLKEIAPNYQFQATSNNLPMADAYKAFGKQVYLYQLLLSVNNLWNTLEYTDSDIANGRVSIPSSSQLTSMLRDLLRENNAKNMRELTNTDEIREALKRVVSEAQLDYNLKDVIEEKMRLHDSHVTKRIQSPLIRTYLSAQLNKLINNKEEADDELLADKLNDLLKELDLYITDNTVSDE